MLDFGVFTLPVIGALILLGYGVSVGPEIVVEPVSVPHVVEEQGLTSRSVGVRLMDEIRRQGRAARSQIREVNPAVENANTSYAALTNYFNVTGFADAFRQAIGLVPYYFTGEYVTVGNQVELRLRAYTRYAPVVEISHRAPLENADDAISSAAIDMLSVIDPYLAALAAERQDVMSGAKNFDRTFKALAKASAAMPASEQHFIHILWGRALLDAGKLPEALRVVDEAVLIAPDFAFCHTARARVLEAMNRHEEAIAAYARAVAIDPGYVAIQVEYAQLLDRAGQTKKAIEVLTEMAVEHPEEASPYFALGTILMREGKKADGIEALRRSVAHTAQRADYFGVYSEALLSDVVSK